MLRLSLQCTDCGYEEENIDLTNDDMLDGQCPICKNHHGNVVYFTDMKVDEFIEELNGNGFEHKNVIPKFFRTFAAQIGRPI